MLYYDTDSVIYHYKEGGDNDVSTGEMRLFPAYLSLYYVSECMLN